MGIRISAYAVDVLRFEEFLDNSLGDLLWLYCDNGTGERKDLYYNDERGIGQFFAFPDGHRVLEKKRDGQWRSLTRRDIESIPFLQRPARGYLRDKSTLATERILGCFSHCRGVDFIREITSGYRRWWIGSLLQYLRRSSQMNCDEDDRLVFVLQKMLRGLNCGSDLPENRFSLESFDFPVIPANEDGLRMGVWTKEEAEFFANIAKRLLAANVRFGRPPGPVGIAPETEDDWHDWVSRMLEQFSRVTDCEFDGLKVVTFIDDG